MERVGQEDLKTANHEWETLWEVLQQEWKLIPTDTLEKLTHCIQEHARQ